MKNTLKQALPRDSILHYWLDSRAIIETPVSFDLVSAMSAIGAMLKRSCWIDQIDFKVYPNMSILLVGPSGIGKDTAIRAAKRLIEAKERTRIIGGMTSEAILDELMKCGDPACAVILAPEFADFFGSKDYQKGMLTAITELLSDNDWKDISLKTSGPRRIPAPTITVFGGSTQAWLHKAMPPETMGGGFYPRFVIVCETEVKRQVPLIKYSITLDERNRAAKAKDIFFRGVDTILENLGNIGELVPLRSAQELYEEWYVNRKQGFSKLAEAYAHRCRDHAFRLAMICAVSRLHNHIDIEDINFGVKVVEYIASGIDSAVALPSQEAMLARELLKVLPAPFSKILKEFGRVYTTKQVRESLEFLRATNEISYQNEIYRRND